MTEAPTQQNIHLPYRLRAQAHHRVLAELACRYTPQGRVLDVGCGLGYALHELHRLNPALELYGADMDETCLKRTGELVPEATLLRMQPDSLDVESLGAGYDAVLMSHVLEHLPNPSEAVRRLLAIVRPAGHLILGVPNPVTPLNATSIALRRNHINPGHLHTWDRRHWINFLETGIGVQVAEYSEDEVRIFPRRLQARARWLGSIESALARVFPWWSHTQFAVLVSPGEPERSSPGPGGDAGASSLPA